MSARENMVLGSYKLEERVGKGGMGEVWRASHTRLGSERAVKVLPAHLAAEEDFLKRFEREAASVSRLDHPNILAIYEYGEANGAPYLVMPYVKGGTLKERMAQGAIPLQETLDYIRQAGEALDYAHEQGIIHRDVKPANLLLDGRGRLYLADFGIAKALEGAEGLTRTGVGVGTPEYMAPEQAQGRADQRSDLYALGVVLYQLLTGRVPFSGNSTVEVLMKHLQDPLPVLPLRSAAPALPPGVERVVAKALAKNPNDRYPTAKALVDDLREAIASGPAIAADPGATVVAPPLAGGNTPPPMAQTGTQPWQVPPGGTPPPQSNTGQQATFAGAAVPAWQNQAGNTPPPLSNTGQQPPLAGGFGGPGGGGPPGPPVYQGGQANNPPPPARSSNRGLLFGGLGALAVLLLLCVGAVAFIATRGGGNDGTPTAQAGTSATASAVAAVNVGATQTANAPTATVRASTAPSAAPSATASIAPSASPSAAPSPSPSPSSSTIPLFPSTSPAPSTSARPSAAPSPTPTVRPSTAPSASPRPSTAPSTSPRPSTAAGSRAPLGQAPAGWKTYSGNASVPFAVYYPPNWTVDESRASEGRVYFYPPGVTEPIENQVWFLIATTGERTSNGNIDVLRNEYFESAIKAEHPEAGIRDTRTNQLSGITFASLAANFNSGTDLCYAYIGLGLNQSVPWRFRLNSLFKDYNNNVEAYFQPMLNSLNIYANP